MKSFIHNNRMICIIDGYIWSIGLANWVVDVYNLQRGIRANIDAHTLGLKEEWRTVVEKLKSEMYV